MHVLFVSESEKKAIARTNAVLDSYAIRVGAKTWASAMTAEGLKEVRMALRKSATRQSAVACFQNDGRRCMKLLWTVGARGKFGPDGEMAVGQTRRRTPAARAGFFCSWMRSLCLLAQGAALLHDMGKYSCYFQKKLRATTCQRDPVRHEWLSVCVLQALRRGHGWERAWQDAYATVGNGIICLGDREMDKLDPVTRLPAASPHNAREAIDYLIATHHRLFADSDKAGRKNCYDRGTPSVRGSHVREAPAEGCGKPFTGAPSDILEKYFRLERRLESINAGRTGSEYSSFWWALLLLARAALVFADHSVSARRYEGGLDCAQAAANTCAVQNTRVLNQPLGWHLDTVAGRAAHAAWRMAQMAHDGTAANLEGLHGAPLRAALEAADEDSRFHWQNVAADALSRWREEHPDLPCLVFNMAGTGSGKTRMNVRAACVLSRSEEVRCALALNLRSLTLQTGEALRTSLGLSISDMAVIIGDRVTQQLFEKDKEAKAASAGSPDGNDDIVDDDENGPEPVFMCDGDTGLLPAWMEPFFPEARERLILSTPLLVSTIDFLDAAGNPHKQGHHVKALLRIMTSDLILDEVDSYEPEALVSVLRTVQLCGLFRRNVICSSATLSLPVAQAVHTAYASGLRLWQSLQGDSACGTPNAPGEAAGEPGFGLALLDDALAPQVHCGAGAEGMGEHAFASLYNARLHDLAEYLAHASCQKRAFLQDMSVSECGFMEAARQAVLRLHGQNAWSFCGGEHSVSFGLVRMANIEGAVRMARHLAATLPRARVACYHAGDWLISRYHKERRLDYLLNRKEGNRRIEADGEIQRIVADNGDTLFVVVATPVEEVGRDHDFDWAVIEPSSAQSLVQTAGRVNRHRLLDLDTRFNLAFLRYNLRHCRNAERGDQKKPAFIWPGYEKTNKSQSYAQHDLAQLLPWPQGAEGLTVNATLRLNGGSKFAQADDAALKERVARFFGTWKDDEGGENDEAELCLGLFSDGRIAAYRMAVTPYAKTPLRDNYPLRDRWQMRVEEGHATYWRWEKGMGTWVHNEREMKPGACAPSNAWLNLTLDELVTLCEQVQIDPAKALIVELALGNREGYFEHDGAFGLFYNKES